MSSTSYPISMNTKDVFNDLRNQAKKRPDLALSDIKVSGKTLWLGGILTTSNARFYYVERHTLSSYAGQISVKSESVDMGFTGTSIPAEILKKLRAEWYWRRNDTVRSYIDRVLQAKSARAAKSAAIKQLSINDRVTYNGQVYRLIAKLGKKGWRVEDTSTGIQYTMSPHRLKQAVLPNVER